MEKNPYIILETIFTELYERKHIITMENWWTEGYLGVCIEGNIGAAIQIHHKDIIYHFRMKYVRQASIPISHSYIIAIEDSISKEELFSFTTYSKIRFDSRVTETFYDIIKIFEPYMEAIRLIPVPIPSAKFGDHQGKLKKWIETNKK